MELNKYEELIQELLTLVLLKEPSEYYKEQIENIKDLIKNNNIEKTVNILIIYLNSNFFINFKLNITHFIFIITSCIH